MFQFCGHVCFRVFWGGPFENWERMKHVNEFVAVDLSSFIRWTFAGVSVCWRWIILCGYTNNTWNKTFNYAHCVLHFFWGLFFFLFFLFFCCSAYFFEQDERSKKENVVVECKIKMMHIISRAMRKRTNVSGERLYKKMTRTWKHFG